MQLKPLRWLVLLCLLVMVSGRADPFNGTGVIEIREERDVQLFLTSSQPGFLIFYDKKKKDSEDMWKDLFNLTQTLLPKVGVQVRRIPLSSPAANVFRQYSPEGKEFLLFVDGLLVTHDLSEKSITRSMTPFIGTLTVSSLVEFVLSNISTKAMERVENFRDLNDLFSLYPGYPNIPRILYFSAQSHLSPMVRSLSQRFAYMAVMGVIHDAFGTEEKRAVANHYGIQDPSDLPRVVVLKPAEEGEDEVIQTNFTSETNFSVAEESLMTILNSGLNSTELSDYNMQLRLKYMVVEMNKRWAEIRKEKAFATPVSVLDVQNETVWNDFFGNSEGTFGILAFTRAGEVELAKKTMREAGQRILSELKDGVSLDQVVSLAVVRLSAVSDAARKFWKVGRKGFPDVVIFEKHSDQFKFYNFDGKFVPERIQHVFVSLASNQDRKGTPFTQKDIPPLVDQEHDGDL